MYYIEISHDFVYFALVHMRVIVIHENKSNMIVTHHNKLLLGSTSPCNDKKISRLANTKNNLWHNNPIYYSYDACKPGIKETFRKLKLTW